MVRDEEGMKKLQNSKPPTGDSILSNHVVTLPVLLSTTAKLVASSYRGKIVLDARVTRDDAEGERIRADLGKVVEVICPSRAIRVDPIDPLKSSDDSVPKFSIDNGKCIMCGKCQESYPEFFRIENEFALPTRSRREMIIVPEDFGADPANQTAYEEIGGKLSEKIWKLFGKSLAIREVDAGSCNGCEVEMNSLNNSFYDIERFGVHFVASPRHADILMVTGPASRNMKIALERTYNATPTPKLVIAVGACACSGGIFGKYLCNDRRNRHRRSC